MFTASLDLGDASKAETVAQIEMVLARSPKNMHCTSAESNILETIACGILTVTLQSMSTCSDATRVPCQVHFCQLMKRKIKNSNYILDKTTFSNDEAPSYLCGNIVCHMLVACLVYRKASKFGNTKIFKN